MITKQTISLQVLVGPPLNTWTQIYFINMLNLLEVNNKDTRSSVTDILSKSV